MRLFEVLLDEAKWEEKYDINAQHKWQLPGVKCDTCGETWAITGVAYPSVDLSALPSERLYRTGWPVSPDELESLRQQLRLLISPDLILPPGTDLGPLIGVVEGTAADFAWLNPWTLLIKREAYRLLESKGLRMPKAVPCQLKGESNWISELLELELEPHSNLHGLSLPNATSACPTCGYIRDKLQRPFSIVKSSVPENIDLFRVQNFPTIILAKEGFKETVISNGLEDINFHEVEVFG